MNATLAAANDRELFKICFQRGASLITNACSRWFLRLALWAFLGSLATGHGFGTILGNSGIVRLVQGGVVKAFRYVAQVNGFGKPIRFAPALVSAGLAISLALDNRRRVRLRLSWGASGAGLGAALGVFSPGYYRSVFSNGDSPTFDPVAVGIGQGLTQGVVFGTLVGLLLVAMFYWSRTRSQD